jgi:hypothetical protein
MASYTESTSGNVTTYVITDMEGNTLTAVVTANGVLPLNVVFTSSGGLHPDGLQVLVTLGLLWQTGVVP